MTRPRPLAERLRARIAQDGPLTVADYMQACLFDPAEGYYATRDPLGAAGDFTTAPEISQIFGEVIGLCLAQAWRDQGAPEEFYLAELGPGRGTLMSDIMRAASRVPGFAQAARLHFVEASPALRAVQAKAHPKASWHAHLHEIPDGPLFLVANEFFDALPIRQFIRDGAGWRERVVGLRGEALTFGLTDTAPLKALSHRVSDTRDGDLVELCPAAAPIASEAARRVGAFGGVALIVDYGDWRSLGDTLQALRAHEKADPLESPGSADLTAHVDFEPLARAAQGTGARATKLTPQGVFLERLGITPRAQKLAQVLTGAALEAHIAAHRRLTHPAEMGQIFKAMAFYPAGSAIPAGRAPAPHLMPPGFTP